MRSIVRHWFKAAVKIGSLKTENIAFRLPETFAKFPKIP